MTHIRVRFNFCWRFLPEENVLELNRGREKGFNLLAKGIHRLTEIPCCFRLTGNQQIQRKVTINSQPYPNKDRIKSFLHSFVTRSTSWI